MAGGRGAGTRSGTLSLAESGTSKDSDARDYFSHREKHMIPFAPAFSRKKADERKEWLRQFKAPEPKQPKPAAAKDDDDDDEPPPPPPPKKRAPPKKALKDSDSEVEGLKRAPGCPTGEEDSDDEPPQAKGKAKAAPKRKSLDSAVDSDMEPPKKKSSLSQPEVTDFFSKAGRSGASSKPEQQKMSKSVKPASPRAAPSRPTRAAPKKYVEIPSDEGEDTAGDQSMFLDDDD
ncbi:hypothetical protein B0H15DRAFT_800871 [Mycena belliarum]|uniref:Uncharacterized protein n=1 Tax=Mycena belliarum TaxID=1033014 RepID=A0AAD6U2N7_9AGAR|nr:hypothetical protein B0H15DRAFT_800871 [Mycena belliae]